MTAPTTRPTTDNELMLNEDYDKVANKLADKNKIDIKISDYYLIGKEPQQNSIRFKDQQGNHEEFLNVVYFGSDRYLWGNNVARDLKSILLKETKGGKISLPTDFVLNLLDITKIDKFAIFTLDFKTINGIKVNYPIAIYHDKTLEIYLPLLNEHSSTREKIFEMILNWGIQQYKPTIAKDEPQKNQGELIKAELERMLTSDKTNEKIRIEDEKKMFEREISDYLEAIKKTKAQVSTREKALAILEKPTDTTKQIGEQLQLLKTNKMIRDIKVSNNKFYVFTKRVKIIQDNYSYDLGSYEMVLDFSRSNYEDKVRIFNELSNPSNPLSRQHPHIDGAGKCCLGNIQNTIANMLLKRQIAETIIVLIAYLHSYHAEGAFTHILPFMETIGTQRESIGGTPRRKKAGVNPRQSAWEEGEDPDDYNDGGENNEDDENNEDEDNN